MSLTRNNLVSPEAALQEYFRLRALRVSWPRRTEPALRRFLNFQASLGLGLLEISSALLQAYSEQPFYTKGERSDVCGWLRFLERRGLTRRPWQEELPRAPFVRVQSHRMPTHELVLQILHSLNLEEPLGLRDRALFELAYGSGLRVGEMVSLDLGDLALAEGCITVRKTKNRWERNVPLTRWSLHYLQRYLQVARPQLCSTRSGSSLWLCDDGRRMGRSLPTERLQMAQQNLLGCRGAFSMHGLRHACATRLLEGGADLRAIQELLGHREIRSTQVYTHRTPTHIQEMHRRFHPRSL